MKSKVRLSFISSHTQPTHDRCPISVRLIVPRARVVSRDNQVAFTLNPQSRA
jgi:hypothetical protein